jgi:hypothetical protein
MMNCRKVCRCPGSKVQWPERCTGIPYTLDQDVFVQAVDCRERTLGTGCENTPSVAWRGKGSTTTAGAASYLLREASMHQRRYRYKQRHFYLLGQLNVLADVLSRKFNMSDSQILAYLNLVAPQPEPWPFTDAVKEKGDQKCRHPTACFRIYATCFSIATISLDHCLYSRTRCTCRLCCWMGLMYWAISRAFAPCPLFLVFLISKVMRFRL